MPLVCTVDVEDWAQSTLDARTVVGIVEAEDTPAVMGKKPEALAEASHFVEVKQ